MLLRDHNIRSLREAGSRLLSKAGRADNKKPLNAIRQTLHNGPLHDWAVQYGFQHQRFVTCRNRVILFQNKHSTTRVIHGKSLLSVRPHGDRNLITVIIPNFLGKSTPSRKKFKVISSKSFVLFCLNLSKTPEIQQIN